MVQYEVKITEQALKDMEAYMNISPVYYYLQGMQ